MALEAHGAGKLDAETAGYAASLGGWVIDMVGRRSLSFPLHIALLPVIMPGLCQYAIDVQMKVNI